MDNEMIERCRAVLWDKHCPGIRRTPNDDKFYTEVVIDVIKAMQEPTEKMVSAGMPVLKVLKGVRAAVWRAMIGAIINE